MTRREWVFVWLISLLAIAALLSGCETLGYIRERHKPVVVPSCPGHGIFHPCGLAGSEWEQKV
jgi:hypothetical protein